MTRLVSGGLYWSASILLIGVVVGCKDEPAQPAATRPTTNQTVQSPVTAPSGDPRARPGHAIGRVLGEDGKPVSIPEARLQVDIVGVSDATNRIVEYHAVVGPDGNYAEKIDKGTYRQVSGRVEFPFSPFGEVIYYRMPLHPTTQPAHVDDGAKGIVRDFVWKLSGLKPGQTPDPEYADAWYGAPITLRYRGFRADLGQSVPFPPPNTKVIFTLTPKGPLADGRTIAPITYERIYAADGIRPRVLNDLPLAIYEVSGREVLPNTPDNAPPRPILLLGEDGKWSTTFEASFAGDPRTGQFLPVSLVFTRPADVLR